MQKNAKFKSHPDHEDIRNSVSNVLAACQQYMREREVGLYHLNYSINGMFYTG